MAFPTTSVLDDFNRANANPMSGSWSYPLGTGNFSPQLLSNTVRASSTGWNDAWYNAAQYGPDAEAYVTIAQIPAQDDRFMVYVRNSRTGGQPNGYKVRYTRHPSGSGDDLIQLYRADAGSDTQLGTQTYITNLSAGDKVGIEVIGNTINAYVCRTGTWSFVMTANDSTYQSAGYLAFELNSAATALYLDDFGGGTIGQVAAPTADSVDGAWTDQAGGTSLYAAIDEAVASSSDYIRSELGPQDSGCRVKLASLTDPVSSTGHVIRWQPGKDTTGGATINMTVKLYQGGG